MDPEVLQDLYERAKSKGYSKTIEEFSQLIGSDQEVLDDNFDYVKTKGYSKDISEFSKLVGFGEKKNPIVTPSNGEVVITDSTTETEVTPISSDSLEITKDKVQFSEEDVPFTKPKNDTIPAIKNYEGFIKGSDTANIFVDLVKDKKYKLGSKGTGNWSFNEKTDVEDIDCSGAVCTVKNQQGASYDLNMQNAGKFLTQAKTRNINIEDANDGDLVVMNVDGKGIDHIGIVVVDENGRKYLAESSSTYNGTTITDFDERIGDLTKRKAGFTYEIVSEKNKEDRKETAKKAIPKKETVLAPVDTSLDDDSLFPYSINGKEVTKKEYDAYKSDTTNPNMVTEYPAYDPREQGKDINANTITYDSTDSQFNQSLAYVTADLVDREESEVVNRMKYHFEDYGFDFEQGGSMFDGLDGMTVTSKDNPNESININLDSLLGDLTGDFFGTEKAEASKLIEFLKANRRTDNKMSELTTGYDRNRKKYFSLEGTKSDIAEVENKARALNTRYNVYLESQTAYEAEMDALMGQSPEVQATPEWKLAYQNSLAAGKRLKQTKNGLGNSFNEYKKLKSVVDSTVGNYIDMKEADDSTFVGGLINSFLGPGMSDPLANAWGGVVDGFYKVVQYVNEDFGMTPEEKKARYIDIARDLKYPVPENIEDEAVYKKWLENLQDQRVDGDKVTSDEDKIASGDISFGFPKEIREQLEADGFDLSKAIVNGKFFNKNQSGINKFLNGEYIELPDYAYDKTRGERLKRLVLDQEVKENKNPQKAFVKKYLNEIFSQDDISDEKFDKQNRDGVADFAGIPVTEGLTGLSKSMPSVLLAYASRGKITPAVGFAAAKRNIVAKALGLTTRGGIAQTVSFSLLQAEAMSVEMNNDPDFKYVTESERKNIVIPTAITVGILERLGFRHLVGNKTIMTGLMNKVTNMLPKGATAVMFENTMNRVVKNSITKGIFSNKGVKATMEFTKRVTKSTLGEAETGGLQQVAEMGYKDVWNNMNNKDMFNQPEMWSAEFFKTVRHAAMAEAVGGFVMGVPGAVINAARVGSADLISDDMVELFDQIANDGVTVDSYKAELDLEVAAGTKTQKEADQKMLDFATLTGALKDLPSDMDASSRKKGLILVFEQQKLEAEMAKMNKNLNSYKQKEARVKEIKESIGQLGTNQAKANTNFKNETEGIQESVLVTEEDATKSLQDKGVQNPTVEQIKTEQDALQKQSTTSLDASESSRSGEKVGQSVPNSKSTEQSESENETENREKTKEKVTKEDQNDIDDFFGDTVLDEVENTSDNLSINRKQKEGSTEIENTSLAAAVVNKAKKAARAIAKLAPNVKIVLHDTQAEYEKYATKGSRGYYNPNSKVIHINLTKAKGNTVAHEVFHAVFLEKISGGDVQAQLAAKKLITAVRKTLPADSMLAKRIDKFAQNYDANLKDEETLAELFSLMSNEYKTLKKPAKNKIIEFIRSMASKLGVTIPGGFGKTDESVIDFMNTFSKKVRTGTEITEGDVDILNKIDEELDVDQEQGDSGQVGTFTFEGRESKAPDINTDTRSYAENIIQKDLQDYEGQNFVTNMYDFTNAGPTDIGAGIVLDLYGGKNYVADMMEKTGGKLGEVSNLAAFNSKENAEGFIKNSMDGNANLFAPHAGTKEGSWQFQQNIFAQLTEKLLDNNIITNKELIESFNSGLTSKDGKSALKTFTEAYSKAQSKEGSNLPKLKNTNNLNDFIENPKKLVELLDIDNNYSPDLRKILNDKIATNDKVKNALGVKNKIQFAEKLEDPMNVGSKPFDLLGVIEFDNTTLETPSKPKKGDADYHPSFAWTVKAKIKAIVQPTNFYQSTEATDSYTKFNKNEVVVSTKTDLKDSKGKSVEKLYKIALKDTRKYRTNKQGKKVIASGKAPFSGTFEDFQKGRFKSSNVSSSAGSGPKVATVKSEIREGREQSTEQQIKDQTGMPEGGYYSAQAMVSDIQRQFNRIGTGYTAKRAKKGAYGGGGGVYVVGPKGIVKNPTRRGRQQVMDNEDDILRIIYAGRQEGGFTDASILDYLKRRKRKVDGKTKLAFTAKEINSAFKVVQDEAFDSYMFREYPKSFNDLKGGFLAGLKLMKKVDNYYKELVEKNNLIKERIKKNIKTKEAPLSEEQLNLKVLDFFMDQAIYKSAGVKGKRQTSQQLAMERDMLQILLPDPLKANPQRIAAINKRIKNIKFDEKNLKGVQRALRNYIRMVLPRDLYTKKEITDLIDKVNRVNATNFDSVKDEVFKIVTKKTNESLETSLFDILNKKYTVIQSGRLKGVKIDNKTRKKLDRIRKLVIGEQSINPDATGNEILDANTELLKMYEAITKKEVEGKKDGDVIKVNKTEFSENDLETMAEITLAMQINTSFSQEMNDPNKTTQLSSVISSLNQIETTGKANLEYQLLQDAIKYRENERAVYKDMTGIDIDAKQSLIDQGIPENEITEYMITKEFQAIKKDVALDAKERGGLKAKNVIARFRGSIKSLAASMEQGLFGTAEDMTGLITRISTQPGEIFEGATQEITQKEIRKASRMFKGRILNQQLIFSEKMTELFGKKWTAVNRKNSTETETIVRSVVKDEILKDQINELTKNKTKKNKSEVAAKIKELNEKIQENTINISQNQLLYYYSQMQDPSLNQSMINTFDATRLGNESFKNEFNSRIKQEIADKLDNKLIELSEWMIGEYYPESYDHYNNTYKEIYRTDMPWNQFYAGRVYRQNENEAEGLDLLADSQSWITNVGSASSKARIANTNPINKTDGVDALLNYTKDMEYFAAYAVPIRNINKIFQSPLIKETIKDKFGPQIWNYINDNITKIANKGIQAQNQTAIINAFNNTFLLSRLGLNPTLILKQMTSFVTYGNDIGYINWVKNAAMSTVKARTLVKEVLNNSVVLQDRYGQSITRTVENYSDDKFERMNGGLLQQFGLTNEKQDKISKVLMWTTMAGDKGAILVGGVPNYLYYKNKFKKANPNATEQEAIDHAIIKFEADTLRTQQSYDLQDKDYFQTKGALVRAFNMFLTTPKQYFRREIISARNMYRIIKSGGKQGKGVLKDNGELDYWRSLGKSARSFAVYHVVMPVLFQWVSQGLPGLLRGADDEDKAELAAAGIMGNINALFIVGKIANSIVEASLGKPWVGTPSTIPVLGQTALLAKLYTDIGKTTDPVKREEKVNKFMAEALAITGIPAGQLRKMMKNFSTIGDSKDLGSFILKLFNFSEYAQGNKGGKQGRGLFDLTQAEMKKYKPEMYKKQQELKKTMPKIRDIQKEIQAEIREKLLDQIYN